MVPEESSVVGCSRSERPVGTGPPHSRTSRLTARRVVITGAAGQLGRELVAAFEPDFDVVALTSDDLDISNYDAVMQTVGAINCDAVINAAAYTDVDGCEEDTARAFAVNALGVRNLAEGANSAGALLSHISTDYVFDGSSDLYREWDARAPVSVYGRSKLAGEVEIAAHAAKWSIVRTAWVYGVTGQNFVRTILKLANENETLDVVADQRGSPTYTADLAGVVRDLVIRRRVGTYHVTNSGTATWCEFAEAIFELAGHDPRRIHPTDSTAYKRPAQRPRSSVLENFAIEASGLAGLRHWREALAECLSRIRISEPDLMPPTTLVAD